MSNARTVDPIVTTEWLADHLSDAGVRIVDASFYPAGGKRNAESEFQEGHIPGAIFLDLKTLSADAPELPHRLPGTETFSREIGSLGISDEDTVVVYDGTGLSYAPRVWWMFRVFGAKRTLILDGGLSKWRTEGRPLEKINRSLSARQFKVRKNHQFLAQIADIQKAIPAGDPQIVDARPSNRFNGIDPEPAGIRQGHIPGAKSVPVGSLVKNGQFIHPEALEKVFVQAGVDLGRPTITTCTSGVAAATLWLALETIGRKPQSLYDGSWLEWGGRTDLPIEK